MEENKLSIQNEFAIEDIKNLIYTIRGKQVRIDSDVANIYHCETKYVNRVVKRNIERFPEEFCFQLNENEFEVLRCQFVTLNENGRGQLLKIAKTNKFHDRFIVLDNEEMYHLGASIKDLGKKCFGINKIEDMEIIEKIINV